MEKNNNDHLLVINNVLSPNTNNKPIKTKISAHTIHITLDKLLVSNNGFSYPCWKIGHSQSERGFQDCFDDSDMRSACVPDVFPGEIPHEASQAQVVKNEWRKRARVEKHSNGHAEGANLAFGSTKNGSFPKNQCHETSPQTFKIQHCEARE